MSRSLHGNYLGRAAQTERLDLMEHNHQMWLKEERQKLIDRENELFVIAAELEGFEAFWEVVPEFGSRRERIRSLEEFIASKQRIEDGFGSSWSAVCPRCHKATMQVVRPGMATCAACEETPNEKI